MLFTAWQVGKYVSQKLKSEEWGSKVVKQLSEFIRSRYPDIKGFSRSNIYNMVMLYDEYSSDRFISTMKTYLPHKSLQDVTTPLPDNLAKTNEQSTEPQTVQMPSGQFPNILKLTSLSNHYEILNRCHDNEERLFYILYANKYQLTHQELRRCVSNHTYTSLLGNNNNLSKGMLQTYPQSPVIFKDKLYLDFLGLPQKHSETKLKNSILEHMKLEATKKNIDFDLKVNCSVKHLIEKFISQSELETLISDHVKDAIIAVGYSESTPRSICVIFDIIDNCYRFSVYDSGIDFEIDTLVNLGLDAITTHKDDGGTGLGFLTTFGTLDKCKASLVIDEINFKNSNFSKSVNIIFDGKHEYIVRSSRTEEIKKSDKNYRIILQNKD